MHQHKVFNDTVYFWFGSNDTNGSGDNGASPICDVRLAGAAAGAAPVYEPTPILLTHANYMPGAYEVAIAATAGNGFADGNTYGVFCSLLVDTQNPTGFVGSFELAPIVANVTEISDDATAATNAESFFDGTGYAGTGNTIPTVTTLTGHTPQTGDNFARLGAPAGVSVSADILGIQGDTDDIQARLPAALVGGRMDSDAVSISGSTAAADAVEANIGNLDAAISTIAAAIAALNDFDPTADNVIVGSVIAAALDDFFSLDSGNTYAGSVAGSVVKEIADNATATVNWAQAFTTNTGETYATAVAGSVVKETADNAGCGGSIGAVEFTYTVTETGTANLLEGAVVWFATDIGGANIVWTGVSDVFGIARATSNNEKPFLDPGTYYVWTQLSGYTFTNPDTEVVS